MLGWTFAVMLAAAEAQHVVRLHEQRARAALPAKVRTCRYCGAVTCSQ